MGEFSQTHQAGGRVSPPLGLGANHHFQKSRL